MRCKRAPFGGRAGCCCSNTPRQLISTVVCDSGLISSIDLTKFKSLKWTQAHSLSVAAKLPLFSDWNGDDSVDTPCAVLVPGDWVLLIQKFEPVSPGCSSYDVTNNHLSVRARDARLGNVEVECQRARRSGMMYVLTLTHYSLLTQKNQIFPAAAEGALTAQGRFLGHLALSWPAYKSTDTPSTSSSSPKAQPL